MIWRLWHAKGDHEYPWRIQHVGMPVDVIRARHVEINAEIETEEKPQREGSHPPPFTILIYSSPLSLDPFQDIAMFGG